MPSKLKSRVQDLPKRHWIYLDGKENPEVVIPEYKAEGVPSQAMPFEVPLMQIERKPPSFVNKLRSAFGNKTEQNYTLKRVN